MARRRGTCPCRTLPACNGSCCSCSPAATNPRSDALLHGNVLPSQRTPCCKVLPVAILLPPATRSLLQRTLHCSMLCFAMDSLLQRIPRCSTVPAAAHSPLQRAPSLQCAACCNALSCCKQLPSASLSPLQLIAAPCCLTATFSPAAGSLLRCSHCCNPLPLPRAPGCSPFPAAARCSLAARSRCTFAAAAAAVAPLLSPGCSGNVLPPQIWQAVGRAGAVRGAPRRRGELTPR